MTKYVKKMETYECDSVEEVKKLIKHDQEIDNDANNTSYNFYIKDGKIIVEITEEHNAYVADFDFTKWL